MCSKKELHDRDALIARGTGEWSSLARGAVGELMAPVRRLPNNRGIYADQISRDVSSIDTGLSLEDKDISQIGIILRGASDLYTILI